MAEAELVKTTYVSLKLTEEEAKWLKGIMQNPLHGQLPTEEDETDKMHRGAIWRTLRVLPGIESVPTIREPFSEVV